MSSSFSFSSEFFDKETEQMYYNYRYYCPPFGRWLSRDPIGEITSRQLLAFNNNNSLLFFDFLGLGTLPSFHFTGPECCDDLRKHIEDLEKELRKHNKDLHDDKDLFGNPEATPRREGGKGTWEGHREMHQIVYNRLKKEIQKYLEKCDDNVPPGAQGLLKYLDEVHEINGPDVPDRIKNPQPIQPIPDPVLPQFPSRPFPNPNYYLPIFIILIMIGVIILIPVGA